ncbi:MAG: hypothetical protein JXA14_26285 [Anaerolineae bacterium]|nr:hypothetical protein [Anaerolineae bacterium]
MMQVTVDGQQPVVIKGRVASIIAHLIERERLINQDANMQVEFNCAGRKVKPVIKIFEDEVVISD